MCVTHYIILISPERIDNSKSEKSRRKDVTYLPTVTARLSLSLSLRCRSMQTMSKEDELAMHIVESADEDDTMHIEVPYNDYGSRGVVDVVREHQWASQVIEIKSEFAVNEVTGANEIIRQVNRHKEYFATGSDLDIDEHSTILIFYATPTTIEHVRENAALYKTCDFAIMFNLPDEGQPAHFSDGELVPDVNSSDDLKELVEVQ